MNEMRRKQLGNISYKLYELKDELEFILSEEEKEYRDDIPESLQDSELYDELNDACFEMENALDCLEEVILHVEGAQE